MIQNIPDELKAYPQFVLWKYEETIGGKPTKVPYCFKTLEMASVTNPKTWGTFDEAQSTFSKGGFSGIGFVLTENDPFTFIDLDNPFEKDALGNFKYPNPDEILDRQIKIHNAFDCYSEKSPSGYGLHIIVKGQVPNGRRRKAVEVYSTARYMTMTGDAYNKAPIQHKQELLHMLWAEMGGTQQANVHFQGEEQELFSDEQIIQKALDATNGDKFNSLISGRWADYYTSQSEADYAFINIIAFYTQNRNQIKRIFRASILGARPKARREDYVGYMINQSFDRMLPPIDMDGLKNQMIAIQESKAKQDVELNLPEVKNLAVERQNPCTFPKGLVGEVAEFIYAQSIYPAKEISLIAALAFLSGICGKAYNISGTGLNNYFVLLAKTGRGKEAMAKGIDKLVGEIKKTSPPIVDFLGPAEFASPQGLVKHLNEHPCFMSILTEFAMMLKQLTAPNANGNQAGLRRMFLNLYNKSGHGQHLAGIVYSDKDKNVHSLNAPAFSFLGECTPEKYYRLLDEDLISEGLLPRFTTIEYNGDRNQANKNHYLISPSPELVRQLCDITTNCNMLISNKQVITVRMDHQATEIFTRFNDEKCNVEINKNENNGVSAELWTRSHVKAMKLAALLAVGNNAYHPLVNLEQAEWAIKIVTYDNENIISRFEKGEVSTNNVDINQIKEMQRIARLYCQSEYSEVKKYRTIHVKMHEMHIIPYKYLNQRLGPLACYRMDKMGATYAIKRTIQTLIDSGDFREIPKGQVEREFGTISRCFAVSPAIK